MIVLIPDHCFSIYIEFSLSMIYKTTVKYQPGVFSEIIYIISEISQFNCK